MKRFVINAAFATATLMVAASAIASAQTVKAEIPFPFQFRETVLPPGTYTITDATINPWLELTNTGTHRRIFLTSHVGEEPRHEWLSSPGGMLRFACRDDVCVLTHVWTNSGRPVRRFLDPAPRQSQTHVAVIRLSAIPAP